MSRQFCQLFCKGKKGKVVPVLNQAPHHKGVLREWRYTSTHSLTLGLDGGEWSGCEIIVPYGDESI
jgi:hypothetical protein